MRASLLGALVLLVGNACAPAAVTPTAALGSPTFAEETASGVEHTYDGGAAFSVGGGVAVFDCNGDGKPDPFLLAAPIRARCIRTRARSAARCASAACSAQISMA